MQNDKMYDPTLEEKDASKKTIDAADASGQFQLQAEEEATRARSTAKDARDLARNPVI